MFHRVQEKPAGLEFVVGINLNFPALRDDARYVLFTDPALGSFARAGAILPSSGNYSTSGAAGPRFSLRETVLNARR